MKKILVIEDNLKHLDDAKKFFSGIDEVEVTYAEDYRSECSNYYNEAGKEVSELAKYDGVISDIFFPLKKGDKTWGQEEPIGASVMVQCNLLKVPCVLNTAGYHHGSRYQWICDLQRNMGLPEIVDASGDYFKDADEKNWERAFEELSKLF